MPGFLLAFAAAELEQPDQAQALATRKLLN